MQIRQFLEDDRIPVINLWKECNLIFPQNDPQRDIDRKQDNDPDLFLVGIMDNEIIASVMGGYEGHRGWAYYLAVKPTLQTNGYGRKIMDELERRLLAKGCPKLNLMVRTGNVSVIEFYNSLGFLQDDVVCLGKRLIRD